MEKLTCTPTRAYGEAVFELRKSYSAPTVEVHLLDEWKSAECIRKEIHAVFEPKLTVQFKRKK